ncbi:MAG: histidine phosphatase family protein [Armatimonadetes bacterium]|nr:histidine phosphatase family protein [Armatimonadota bacterium]
MDSAVELWLVRHGETVWNAAGLVCGWSDVPLTARGQGQARSLRSRLTGQVFDSVWSSDLCRAVETAQLAYGAPRVDARLRELHFGQIEGVPWETLDPLHRNALLEFEGFRAPDGESTHDFSVRVFELLNLLSPGRHLLFVHAGLVRLVLRAVGNDEFLPPSSIAALEWTTRRLLFLEQGPPSPG